jgi:hypothetical protein
MTEGDNIWVRIRHSQVAKTNSVDFSCWPPGLREGPDMGGRPGSPLIVRGNHFLCSSALDPIQPGIHKDVVYPRRWPLQLLLGPVCWSV